MQEKLPQVYEPGRMSVQRHFVLLGSLLLVLFIFLERKSFSSSSWGLIAVLMLLVLGGCAFHWCIYFAYDKK